MSRLGTCVVLLVAVYLTGGCGGGGPKLVPVDGTVRLDGKPLANKTIMFAPESGTAGSGAGGTTDAQGHYTLTAILPGSTASRPGIAPGTYRVMIMEQMAAATTGTETGAGSESAEIFAAGPTKSDFPPIYSTPNSPIKKTVSEPGGTMEIELTLKP